MHTHDILNHIASDRCRRCGGPAPHWKCPRCRYTSEQFDPSHWRICRFGAKLQARCESCGEAEEHCTCTTHVPLTK